MSTEYDYLKEELDEVKLDVEQLKTDTNTIKIAVTNHISHQLADIQTSINNLDERITPFEKRKLKKDGAHEFVTIVVKVIIGTAGLVWTILEIGKHLG